MKNSEKKTSPNKTRNKPQFADLLRFYRHRTGLTQAQVADLLGLKSDRMVRNWEVGLNLPNANRLEELIRLFLTHRAFTENQEIKEAAELWEAAKVLFEAISEKFKTYPLWDERWFTAL